MGSTVRRDHIKSWLLAPGDWTNYVVQELSIMEKYVICSICKYHILLWINAVSTVSKGTMHYFENDR